MPATLPTPIVFRLPEAWRAVDPDDAGVPGAAFVALVADPDDGFTANFAVDGESRLDPDARAGLRASAEAAHHALRDGAAGVELLDRVEVGPPEAPALTQTLRITAAVHGRDRELVQAQVMLSLPDEREPARRAVVRLVLTATAEQYERIRPDFQWVVSTIAPDRAPDRAPTSAAPA